MKTCLKVGLLVLLALLLAAGAALAVDNPGSGPDQVTAQPGPSASADTPPAQPGLRWMFV
jgi:hypothetical protein